MICRSVPFVPQIKSGKDEAIQASEQLNDLIKRMESSGWSFRHLEDVTTLRNNGCLASLAGNPHSVVTFQVAVFSHAGKQDDVAQP